MEGMRPCLPTRNVRTFFWRDTLLNMGFQTHIFCSKVPSKCRKCRFKTHFVSETRHYGLPLTKILATLLKATIQSSGLIQRMYKEFCHFYLNEYSSQADLIPMHLYAVYPQRPELTISVWIYQFVSISAKYFINKRIYTYHIVIYSVL